MKIDYKKDLNILLNYFIEIANSIKGEKINGSKGIEFAEPIAKKTFSHISSLYSLSKGVKMILKDNSHIEFIDHSSITVLLRAALESYLTFNHLYIAPMDNSEKTFRFHCWDLAGFIERKDFKTESDWAKKRKENEIKLILEKKEIIKDHELFLELTPKQQTQLLEKGKWKINKSWSDLAIGANLDKGFFSDLYSFLCGYAHTGRLSTLQIKQAKTLSEQHEMVKSLIGFSLVILSKQIYDYAKVIPSVFPALNSNKEGKTVSETWKEVGEHLKKNDS